MMGNKIKILHLIESEGVYGAERVILNLSKEMLLAKTNFIPVVGCIVARKDSTSSLYEAAQSAGIDAVKIPISNKHLWRDLPLAAHQLKALKIDLIHSHGYKPSVFGFIIRLLKKIPVMATCHLWFEPSKGPLKMRIMIRLEKFFYRWFPKVIAVSEPIKAVLLSNNLSTNQVDVVHNGVDIPAPDLMAVRQIKQELKIEADDFVVLNSARLNRQKAQWVLIEAAALIKRSGIPIKVLIVGEGPLKKELEALIAERELTSNVFLLGFRNDVNHLLQLCNVFTLPSIDEGMPMSLLESAAANKPIVSTNVGDIGKLIKHEHSGLVIPLEDPQALAKALIQLKEDPYFAKKLATAAHDLMKQNYSSESMFRHYSAIYKEILQGNHNDTTSSITH